MNTLFPRPPEELDSEWFEETEFDDGYVESPERFPWRSLLIVFLATGLFGVAFALLSL